MLYTSLWPSRFQVILQTFQSLMHIYLQLFLLRFCLYCCLPQLLPTTSRNHEVKQLPLIFPDKCPPQQIPQGNWFHPGWAPSQINIGNYQTSQINKVSSLRMTIRKGSSPASAPCGGWPVGFHLQMLQEQGIGLDKAKMPQNRQFLARYSYFSWINVPLVTTSLWLISRALK